MNVVCISTALWIAIVVVTPLAITVSSSSQQEPTTSIRRKKIRSTRATVPTPNTRHLSPTYGGELPPRRRSRTKRKLLSETECTLYLRLTQRSGEYPTQPEDDQTWMCEIPMNFDEGDTIDSTSTDAGAVTTQSIPTMMVDIRGLTRDFFDRHGAKSGVSVLRVSHGYLEGTTYETSHGSNHTTTLSGGRSDEQITVLTTMVVPPDANVELNDREMVSPSTTEEDLVLRQRRLRPPNTNHASGSGYPPRIGVLTTLVIRVIGKNGTGPEDDLATTRDNVFEDEVCLKTQLEACSKGQLLIRPFNGTTETGVVIEGGVVDVQIDVDPFNEEDNTTDVNANRSRTSRYRNDKNLLFEQRANLFSTRLLGNLPDQFDLVLFCFPPDISEDGWIGHANIGRFDSYYNNQWCGRVSLQVHEVGHSLGLAHSGQRPRQQQSSNDIYEDVSGMMGYSYPEDDGPRMCFNPAKNFQLDWYSKQEMSIDPTTMVADADAFLPPGGITNEFVLNGVVDYEGVAFDATLGDGDTDHLYGKKLVVLRLEDTGAGKDYYVGYNRAVGANTDTQQDADKVVIVEKPSGGPYEYGQSWNIAALGYQNQMVVLPFGGANGNNSFVEFKLLNTTVGCENSPVDAWIAITHYHKASSCATNDTVSFRVKGKTDSAAYQTSWSLRAVPHNDTTSKHGHYDAGYVGFGSNYRKKKGFHEYFELCPDTCYVFTIKDSNGDGMKTNQGAYYEGILNRTESIFRVDNFVGSEGIHRFCVDTLPDPSCEDASDLQYRKRKGKNCSWVSRKSQKRCGKRWRGKRISDWCPKTCHQCGS